MKGRVSVKGKPVGGVQPITQSVATVTLTFQSDRMDERSPCHCDPPIPAEARVVQAQRSLNCFTKVGGYLCGSLTAHLGNTHR